MTRLSRIGFIILAHFALIGSAHAAEPGIPDYSFENFELTELQGVRAVFVPTAEASRPIIASFSNAGLRFYRRTDEGTYDVSELMPFSGGYLSGFHAADVSGDGLADLCFAYGEEVVALHVLLQTESGGFVDAPKGPFATPHGTRDIAVGDLDGDGRPELVACGTDFVIYYEGLGEGRFGYPRSLHADGVTGGTMLAVGQKPGAANRVAVARVGIGPTDVNVVVKDPVDGFRVEQTLPMQNGAHTMRVVDFDADGDDDVVAIGRSGTTWAQVATLDGSGYVVHPRTVVPESTGNYGAFIDDVDDDGLVDAVCSNSRGLSILFGQVDSSVGFAPPRFYGHQRAFAAPAYDITGDGLKELFVGAAASVYVYENDGRRFAEASYLHLIDSDGSARQTLLAPWADLERPMLLVHDNSVARLRRIEFDPSGDELVVTGTNDPSLMSNGFAYAFADVDADGLPDLLTLSYHPNGGVRRLSYRLSRGGGAFRPSVTLPDSSFRIVGWDVCDVNGDQADDVIVFGSNAHEAAVYLGGPGAGITDVIDLQIIERVRQIGTGDFDGDGFDDAALFLDDEILVRYGHPSGLSADEQRVDLPAGLFPSGLDLSAAVGDLDGDGLPDLAFFGRSASFAELEVLIYYALPGRGFVAGPQSGLSLDNPKVIRIADLNNDRRAEIVAFDDSQAHVLASDVEMDFRVVASVPVVLQDDVVPLLLDINRDGLMDIVDTRREDVTIHFAVRGHPCLGDVDIDGDIDWFDVSAWLSQLQSNSLHGDLDGNGLLNYFDLVIVLQAFADGCG